MELSGDWGEEEFLSGLTSVAESTARIYERDLRAFMSWAISQNIASPDQVTRLKLRNFVAHLVQANYARTTISRKASVLRRYFDWATKKGFCREDPSLVLVTPSIPQHLPKVIAGKELSSLLVGDRAVLQEENEHRRRRDDAVFELLYGSGLRASELCGLTLDSVQLGERQVRVVGKGSKERIIPLSVPCIEKLKTIWKNRVANSLKLPASKVMPSPTSKPIPRGMLGQSNKPSPTTASFSTWPASLCLQEICEE